MEPRKRAADPPVCDETRELTVVTFQPDFLLYPSLTERLISFTGFFSSDIVNDYAVRFRSRILRRWLMGSFCFFQRIRSLAGIGAIVSNAGPLVYRPAEIVW